MSAISPAQELYEVLDARTISILERRRSAAGMRRRGWLVRRALLVADVMGLTSAFVLAELVYSAHAGVYGTLNDFIEVVTFVLSLPLWVVAAKLYGLYEKDEERADHSTTDDFTRVFHLLTVCTFLLYAVSRTTQWFNPEFNKLLLFWVVAPAAMTSLRASARALCRRHISYLQNTIIIGAGAVGQTIARKLLKHPEYGLNLVGFVDDAPRERIEGLRHLTILGAHEDVPELVRLLDVERVIFAFSNDDHAKSIDLIRTLNEGDIQIDIVPRFFEILSPGVELHSIEGLLMCALRTSRLSRSSYLVKRSLDLLVSFIALIVLMPLFCVVALAIKVDSRGPVFFRQLRTGERDAEFQIWKFRTMSVDAEERKAELRHLNKHLAPGGDPRMFKIDQDPRVTRVGAILRRWSLDELPQLINVVLGEMSLVGPRPLIAEEARHVADWGRKRVDLKPGVTGLWQVTGRDQIGFSEMMSLDYIYATSWTLSRDLKLLAKTLPAVVRKGA